jgi:cation:H+ antiporter
MEHNMANPWFQFFLSAVVIVWAGNRLTLSAKAIADYIGLGAAWAGVLLLPLVTSLPELVTSLRAVAIDAPDLAVGNIFGSNLFNLALLAVIDLAQGRGTLTARVNSGHILTAGLSIITVCLALLSMFSRQSLSIAWVGFDTALIAGVYLFGSRLLFKYEQRHTAPFLEHQTGAVEIGSPPTTRTAVLSYLFSAALIVSAGVFLTDAADVIALETGLGHTFIGSLLLAVSTSLPEAVTTLTAVRLGLLDMAVANIFGANFFNLLILFWSDLFFRRAPLLSVVSDAHLISAVMVILMTAVVITGLIYRSQRELVRIGYDSLAVLVGYIIAFYFLFTQMTVN